MTMDPERAEALRRRYLADQVTTATPAQRLLMLFDQLLRNLRMATQAFSEGDLKAINDNLVRAQEIVFALRDPLDVTTSLGEALDSVYTFCVNELIQANLRKQVDRIAPVQAMIEQIANANRQAATEEELARVS